MLRLTKSQTTVSVQVNYRVSSPKKAANGKAGFATIDSDSDSGGSDFEGAESASSEDDDKLPGRVNDPRKGHQGTLNPGLGLHLPPDSAKAAPGATNGGTKPTTGPIISLAKGSPAAGAMIWPAGLGGAHPSHSMNAPRQGPMNAQVFF